MVRVSHWINWLDINCSERCWLCDPCLVDARGLMVSCVWIFIQKHFQFQRTMMGLIGFTTVLLWWWAINLYIISGDRNLFFTELDHSRVVLPSWIVERRLVWPFIDSVNSWVISTMLPILKIESTWVSCLWEFIVIGSINTHALSWALWLRPFLLLSSILFMSHCFWPDYKWQDLIVDLLGMDRKQLL